MSEPHERRCWNCGNVAMHADAVAPAVLCKKCGSQDTRRTKRSEPIPPNELDRRSAQRFFSENWLDEQGNPAGGVVSGRGFTISWQNGPLGRGSERREPNGAFVEDVIAAVTQRIEFYQQGRFACDENLAAINQLRVALAALALRTRKRETRAVEGTHEV